MTTQQMQWSNNTGWTIPSAPLAAVQLVFLFGSTASVVASGSLELARRLYPKAHIVGCSTSGEIHGETVSHDSVSMTAVAFEHTAVQVATAEIRSPDRSRDAGAELARALPLPELTSVFVISEGVRVRGSQLVQGIASVLPPHITVTGGCASNEDRGLQTHVWCDGEPVDCGAIAVGFYGSHLRVNCGVSGAWGPFGAHRLVTRARGNVLYELDGRPALGLYKLYLGDQAAHLPASALLFPMMVREHSSQREVLRALLAIDEQEQSVILAGDIEEGSYARLMRGTIERLIDGTTEMARSAFTGLSVDLAIVVSCFGRQKVLKQRTEEELDAVREALSSGTPIAGFYSYGEIAPIAPGERPELHNETIVVTTFSEV